MPEWVEIPSLASPIFARDKLQDLGGMDDSMVSWMDKEMQLTQLKASIVQVLPNDVHW